MESITGPLASLVNPLSFSFPMWLASLVLKELALQAADLGVTCACRFLKELPSRTGQRVLYKNQLDHKDMMFLSVNSVIEAVFTCHIFKMMWTSPLIFRSWSSFTILTGPLALLLIVLLNDMFYAPAHRLLHHPSIYPFIHKHHHRSVYPTRGNIDARNEHPVEQLIAMTLWMTAVHITAYTVGLHAAALGTHLAFMTTGASLNHAGYDFDIRFLGLDLYSTGAHEMHHRRPDKNFGQFTMLWDKMMGTYIPYEEGAEATKQVLGEKAE
ncbi:Msmo1 [Symbiodinium natans]|uniref:Msmo1 protein n=1 Tax=Symbiodinium natans TaxID=878477 RepID=A0A812QYF1_9DINO|nr:Msmo1 [Symbiodinium natans]